VNTFAEHDGVISGLHLTQRLLIGSIENHWGLCWHIGGVSQESGD